MAALKRDGEMPTIEERVAYLEGRGDEHATAISGVRTDVRDLRIEVRDLRTDVTGLRTEMNRRLEQLESKIDTKFVWMIGFQFATLMAVIAALLNVRLR